MKKELFADKVRTFIRTASAKGSEMGDFLLPECTEDDILRMEKAYGITFTDEIIGYAQVLGRGLRQDTSGTVRSSALEFMPGDEFISLDMGLECLRLYQKSDVLVSKHFKKHFIGSYLVPFATNMVDFVSFCQRPQGGTGVMVKRNSHDVASELWLSAEAFFDYQTQCWEQGGYQLHSSGDTFDWDIGILEDLKRQFSRDFVHD